MRYSRSSERYGSAVSRSVCSTRMPQLAYLGPRPVPRCRGGDRAGGADRFTAPRPLAPDCFRSRRNGAGRPEATAAPHRPMTPGPRSSTALKEELARRGYAGTTVTSIARRARVLARRTSTDCSPTRRRACSPHSRTPRCHHSNEVVSALERSTPAEAHRHVLEARLANSRGSSPSDFNLLTQEALVAGPRALARRNRVLETLGDHLESRWQQASGRDPLPDLPALLIIGGIVRYLRDGRATGSVDWERDAHELDDWIEATRCRAGVARGVTSTPSMVCGRRSAAAGHRIRAPRQLPRGPRSPRRIRCDRA